jgi:hypothetical protein
MGRLSRPTIIVYAEDKEIGNDSLDERRLTDRAARNSTALCEGVLSKTCGKGLNEYARMLVLAGTQCSQLTILSSSKHALYGHEGHREASARGAVPHLWR